jgi:hypothetical protein
LTSGPVAVRVVEAVVGVVEGAVVGAVEAAGELDPVVVGAGDVRVESEEVGELLVAVADGNPPRMGRAPFV